MVSRHLVDRAKARNIDQGENMPERQRVTEEVLRDLAAFVLNNEPAMVSEWGNLFIPPNSKFAAIRLCRSAEEYVLYLTSQKKERWLFYRLIPVDGQPFHIVVNGAVTVEDGKTKLNGKPAIIL
jgi:hypothetical protein